jgi:arabinose-5-phosphate isomerase
MRVGERCPTARQDITVFEALRVITKARAGSVVITDKDGRLTGIFTDGDFRRHWAKDADIGGKPIAEFMTSPCQFIHQDERLADARTLMSRRRVNELPVVDDDNKVAGLLDIQDIVQNR